MATPQTPSAPPPPPPPLGMTYIPIAIDIAVRYLFLTLWRLEIMPTPLFWVAQVGAGIGMLVYLFGHRNDRLIKQTGLESNRIYPTDDPASRVIAILVFMGHAAYQSFEAVSGSHVSARIPVSILVALASILYIFFVYVGSAKVLPKDPAADIESIYDPVDENDRLLIKLQTHVETLEKRVESYTIESTLIGALAFSAFVTIVASDKATVEAVGVVLKEASQAVGLLIGLHGKEALVILEDLAKEKTVLAAVASQALVCSMCFLAVIIARLRFNSLVAPANYSIQMATALNKKEDDLAHHVLTSGSTDSINARLLLLEKCVEDSLAEANEEFQKILPIVVYMGLFRGFGVAMFLLALVTSAAWVSPLLATSFAGISVLTYSYPVLDRWLRDASLRNHSFFRFPLTILRKKRS